MTLGPGASIPPDMLSSGFEVDVVVESWLGDTYLGDVPVESGSVSWDSTQQVQGSLSLTVPRVGAVSENEDWRDWDPTDPEHPLAPYGQVLRVHQVFSSLLGAGWWQVPVGRFLITSVEPGTSTVKVSGKSLMQRVEEDRLTTPLAPRGDGTLASELRRLVGDYMGVVIHPALVDRWCPSMTWGESRIDAVYEIATAWPAVLREGGDGILYVNPPTTAPTTRPAIQLSDGEDGTIIGVSSSVTRDKVYNRVVARGEDKQDEGAPSFQAIADQQSGPMRVGGPYGVVPRFFSSPLITSAEQAQKSAETLLAESVRRQLTVPVEHVPNPTITLDAPVEITTQPVDAATPKTMWGVVRAYEVPLTYQGQQKTDVEVIQ